ncbi:tyrosine-type recombinase/integrase [Vibrio agarivorans]|uniref:tyrosine-type recombinase/integrase n=1 Tax=Vibrio agarivorans TaxID=153622 RepID=UPI0025B2E80E|nr:site-specific integrase [Vibrio agarivorans]MDN3663160.1 integrase arm-type DNA-binding domain-containing protein [Vibrio agarivorans]
MLTAKEIKSFKPKSTPYYRWDKSGERGKGRLAVQVSPSGSKSFKFRYFKNTKPVFIALGKLPGMTLSQARDLTKEYSGMLSQGLDPKEELKQRTDTKKQEALDAKKAGTFEQLMLMFTEDKKSNGNRGYENELKKIVDNVYPYIDIHKKAKDFKAEDFIQPLAIPIEEGFEPKSNKLRSILHAAFNFALRNDNDPKYQNRDIKFGVIGNPISDIPKQTQAERAGTHYMTWEEVSQLLFDMEYRYSDLNFAYQTRQVLRLCFYLGGQRPHEVVTIKWSEVDFEQKTVLIREEFEKTKKPHIVPLTDSAIKILKDVKEQSSCESPFVFFKKTNVQEHMPTNTIAQAILTYKKATKVRPFVARDFRRTVKTLGGQAKISKEYRDRIQGHAISDVSGKHYDMYEYLDEKREGLEIWERALNKHINKLMHQMK